MILDANNKNANRSWYLAALILKTVSMIRQYRPSEAAMQDLLNSMPQEASQEFAAYLTKVDPSNPIGISGGMLVNKEGKGLFSEEPSESNMTAIKLTGLLEELFDRLNNNSNVRGLPPKRKKEEFIRSGRFSAMLIQNYNKLLDSVEPNAVADFTPIGQKH